MSASRAALQASEQGRRKASVIRTAIASSTSRRISPCPPLQHLGAITAARQAFGKSRGLPQARRPRLVAGERPALSGHSARMRMASERPAAAGAGRGSKPAVLGRLAAARCAKTPSSCRPHQAETADRLHRIVQAGRRMLALAARPAPKASAGSHWISPRAKAGYRQAPGSEIRRRPSPRQRAAAAVLAWPLPRSASRRSAAASKVSQGQAWRAW